MYLESWQTSTPTWCCVTFAALELRKEVSRPDLDSALLLAPTTFSRLFLGLVST